MPYSSTSTGQRTFVGNDSLYAAAVCGSAMFAGADAALVRPADTTATVVGGAIGSASSAVFKFSGFFEGDAAHGLLTGMRLIVSGPAGITVPAGIAIRAHLFTADVAMGASLGHVDFTDFVGGGTGADAFYAFGKPAVSPLHVKAADGADDLYAILVATAVFTPISGAVHALSASRAGL
jgi:hypothetical protein